ncbi:hypothetical protein B0T25DRAFT_563393 [Lasiosphaeria hispida]|uniref:Uncharacterized protein n=1 Tax=Lasiosphaeria hispida TaxID=260671 RepID=A0AAJ0ML07_9PEZI|nr:hypothetical protein B0T25DRAFT_563393 [Lasiosphaeria hispida]
MDLGTGESTLMGIFESAISQSIDQVSSRHTIDIDVMIDLMKTTLVAGRKGLLSAGIHPRSPAVPGARLRQSNDAASDSEGSDNNGRDNERAATPSPTLVPSSERGESESGGTNGDESEVEPAQPEFHNRVHRGLHCTLTDVDDPATACTGSFRDESALRDHRHRYHHVFTAGESGAEKERSTSAAWLGRVGTKTLGRRIPIERGQANQVKACYPPIMMRLHLMSKKELIAELITTRQEWTSWESVEESLAGLEQNSDDEDGMDID